MGDISTQNSSDNSLVYIPKNLRINDSEIINLKATYDNYYNKERVSRPFITKFERSKIIGIRAEQISAGADPLIELDDTDLSIIDIAEREFLERKTPLMIRRYLTNNTFEDWRLKDFIR